jgi:GntR family transcriptional regulator/MocR family aminotransferase
MVLLFVDSTSDRALAAQLYEQLRDAIIEGRLGPGERLSPTRTVAADLGVSRSTVTDAYGRLSAEGFIVGRAGAGSVVAAARHQATCRRHRQATVLAPTSQAARLRPFDPDPTVEGRFDLRPGRVDPSLFPTKTWRRCMTRALDHPPSQYGDPAGTYQLRTALTQWIARSRGMTTAPDDIVVTSGAAHAVDLAIRVITRPGDTVCVEEPGYPPVVELFRSWGLNVVGAAVDEEGISVEQIPRRAKLVYVTPSHQYPLGVVMSRHRRHQLLRWACINDAAIIEDDYDSEFRHTNRPLEPLQLLDRDGRVLYVGTFSKTLTPSLRVGFLAAPAPLIPAIHAVRQAIDWCPPVATQHALTEFITAGHLDRHLRRSRITYRERHRLIRQALTHHLPANYRPLPIHAGLHLAILGPQDPGRHQPPDDLWADGLLVASLAPTYHTTNPPNGFLLGFGALPTHLAHTAIRTLARKLRESRP